MRTTTKENRLLAASASEEHAMYSRTVRTLVSVARDLFTKGKTNMKTIMKTSISLPMAAMFLTAALAGSAAAEKLVPFRGAIQGRETDVTQGGPPPTTLSVNGEGSGIATQLGQYTVTWTLTVNLANGTATGSFHFFAANGDSLDTTVFGQSQPTDTPNLFRVVENNTITGGTGRFAGAKGSFTLERLVDLTNLPTVPTSGSFFGHITPPGAAH